MKSPAGCSQTGSPLEQEGKDPNLLIYWEMLAGQVVSLNQALDFGWPATSFKRLTEWAALR